MSGMLFNLKTTMQLFKYLVKIIMFLLRIKKLIFYMICYIMRNFLIYLLIYPIMILLPMSLFKVLWEKKTAEKYILLLSICLKISYITGKIYNSRKKSIIFKLFFFMFIVIDQV